MVPSLTSYDLPFPQNGGSICPNIHEWPYLCNGWSDPLNVCFYGGVFGDGGSNGAIYGSNKSKMAAAAILEKFQIPISLQPVVGSTSCFVLRWGFSGTAVLMALFLIRTNSRWRPPPSWVISNGNISATATYTPCPKKTCDHILYNNFNNKCPITIIFGIVSSKSMSHRKLVSFPTSPI